MLNLISWSCKIYEFLSRILNIFFEDHYFLRLFHFLIENIVFYYKRLLSQLLIASLARKENSPLRFYTVLVAIVLTTESLFFAS